MRRLTIWLLLVVLAFVVQTARAGEVGLSWDVVDYPHPISYNIYRLPDVTTPVAQTVATQSVLTVADNCVTSDYSITAVGNPGGESALSQPIQTMARPTIATVQFNDAGVDRLSGKNYPTNVQVFVDGVAAVNVNRINCQTVEIPTTVGTPTTIEVRNPQADGTLSVIWLLPPPTAPIGGTAG